MDPETTPEPVVLILADISGYTKYMTANAKTLAHSQTIITELVKTIVAQVDLPLEVAKLEGDAVFLYGRKGTDSNAWSDKKKVIGQKLLTFFDAFGDKLRELSTSTTCKCHACAHIEKLRLKLIVHSGEALFHQVLNFQELAGVDVIIAHRLLKNSVPADQYLLLTEAAQRDVELPAGTALAASSEKYDNIGRIAVGVYYPAGASVHGAEAQHNFARRFAQSWSLMLKLWFSPLKANRDDFHHINSAVGSLKRAGFAFLTLILTPIYLPVAAVFVLFNNATAKESRGSNTG